MAEIIKNGEEDLNELLLDIIEFGTLTVGDKVIIKAIIDSGEVKSVSMIGFDLSKIKGTLPQIAKLMEIRESLDNKTDRHTGELLAPYTEEEEEYLEWERVLGMHDAQHCSGDMITGAVITEDGLVVTHEFDDVFED